MSNKTVIGILVVAAALTAFIFFFERGSLSTSELNERRSRVFTEYKRERIDQISLKHISGGEVTLEKTVSAKDPDGQWSIVKPKALKADQTEVSALLSSLDYLLADRGVAAEKNLEDSRFGFDAPRIKGSFSLLGKVTTFEIGADAEGEKVYIHTSQAKDTIFAVNEDILTSLDKSVNDLRAKRLVQDDLNAADVVEVKLKRTLGELSFSKRDDDWRVSAGEKEVLADRMRISELINTAGDLSAEQFIADDVKPDALSKYGLSAPAVEITASRKDKEPVAIRLGAPCKDNPALRYATVVSSGTVACVKDDVSPLAERPLLRFEETRLSNAALEDIKEIQLTKGDKSLSMERKDASWTIKDGDIKLDKDTVNELLSELTEKSRAVRIDTDEAVLSALSKPQGTVTLLTEDDKEFVLELFGKEEEQLKVRRKGEDALLRVPATIDTLLTTNSLTYRVRTIDVENADFANRIEITGRTAQTVEKKDGLWRLTSPVAAAADMGAARRLAELTSQIKAERFVAPVAKAEHGFDRPFAVIKTRFSSHHGGHTHEHSGAEKEKEASHKKETASVLEIGNADAQGLRYARLGGEDQTVFLVSDDYEFAIQRPLIARDLIQIDETSVRRLTFKIEDKEKTFFKDDQDEWQQEGGASFDAEAFRKIVADLGAVKTIDAEAFGDATDFSNAVLTIVSSSKDDKTPQKTITVGQRSADIQKNAYLARTDKLDVTFSIPARIVDDILRLLAP